jgi:hypothetical protein
VGSVPNIYGVSAMLKPPLTFSVPSILNDTEEARAKAEQDFKKIVREAVWYFGPEMVRQVIKEITKRRKGNTPDERRNSLMLAEYDSAPQRVNKTKFARDFFRKHGGQSPEAVEKQLTRLLKARQQAEAKKKAQLKFPLLKAKTGKTFLGTE